MNISEMIERERAVGVAFGPAHRTYLMHKHGVPERVHRMLELGRKYPEIVASRQYYADMIAEPPLANLTALVATTIEALWPAATYTPIFAGDANKPGKVYRITAGGIWSTGASGTLIITPNVGTATGGATMGASPTETVPVSISNIPWYLEYTAVIRTVGTSGTIIGTGTFNSTGIAANTSPGAVMVTTFGGTSATIDTTAASGITIGKTLSVAGSVTPQYVVWQSLN